MNPLALYNDSYEPRLQLHRLVNLLLLMLLAGELKDAELLKWSQLELGGYVSDNSALTDSDIVPEYRAVMGQWLNDFGQVFLIDYPKVVSDGKQLPAQERCGRTGTSRNFQCTPMDSLSRVPRLDS